MKNRNRQIARIVAMVLAVLMLLSTLASGLSLLVSAADGDGQDTDKVARISASFTSCSSNIRQGKSVEITFKFTAASAAISESVKDYTPDFTTSDSWWDPSNASMQLVVERESGEENGVKKWVLRGTIKNLKYDSADQYQSLSIGNIEQDGVELFPNTIVSISIPESKFDSGLNNNGSDDDDPISYTPLLLPENAVALDSSGKRIDEITKDSPSFTLEVTYADMGLQSADLDDLKDGEMQAFFTNNASFEIAGSTRGSLRLVSDNWDYPRFRATFTGVTYTGVGKDIDFQVFYLFGDLENTVSGTGKATLTAAKVDKEDEDDKKMKLPAPKIIISSYTYGQDTIVAGSEFKLDFSITNTSGELPVENVVVTLTPASNEAATKGPGLIVASSSNTIYVPVLEAGATQNYSVAFQARPDAEVTSHLITVRFSYEYVDTNQEERVTVPDLSESIAIPVSQIDRFSVDPITDSIYGMVGEEAYLTVSFINKGKSSTNNVSASIRCENPALTAPGQHYGNLEAGKADTLDLYLTATAPGEYSGDVVIQYEDENNNEKEVTTPFSLFVEEPYYPPQQPQTPPEDLAPPPTQGPGALTLVLCVIGGLAIAVPIALYLMKRVKAKGSEDFDEVF